MWAHHGLERSQILHWAPWCPYPPHGVCMGPVWGGTGTVQLATQYGCPWLPLISPWGPLAGLVWATKGHYGHARTGPTLSLVRAQPEPALGPIWALAGHTGHARAKPIRAPAGAAIWVLINWLRQWTMGPNLESYFHYFDQPWLTLMNIDWSFDSGVFCIDMLIKPWTSWFKVNQTL